MTQARDRAKTIIDVLLAEHRNIKKLLHVLEQEISEFDRSNPPDYEIIQAIIEYFQDYPEGYHHPKEDMVFEKLKLRDPAVAKRIGDIEDEHEIETVRLQKGCGGHGAHNVRRRLRHDGLSFSRNMDALTSNRIGGSARLQRERCSL